MLTEKTSGDDFQLQLDRTVLLRDKVGGNCGPAKRSNESYELRHVFVNADASGVVPKVPYWFMNATAMIDRRIVPFTSWKLREEQINAYWHDAHIPVCTMAGICAYEHIPLALGLRTSMNFPLGIPATRLSLKTGDYFYLTDGGAADNLGVLTAMAVLDQEGQSRRPNNRRVLIVIDAYSGVYEKDYTTSRALGLIRSSFRGAYLPMDAHRFRIRQDFYLSSTNQLTLLDAMSASGDISVVYIDMYTEPRSRAIGTTLGLSLQQQRALVCAGKRQALEAIGEADLWRETKDTETTNANKTPAELTCDLSPSPKHCPSHRMTSDGDCSHFVAFNRQSKAALVDALARQLRVQLTGIRNRSDRLAARVENTVARTFREHQEDLIRNEISAIGDRQSVAQPTLTIEKVSAFRREIENYRSTVTMLKQQISIAISEELDAGSNSKPDSPTPPKEIDDETSRWQAWGRRILNWFLALSDFSKENSNVENVANVDQDGAETKPIQIEGETKQNDSIGDAGGEHFAKKIKVILEAMEKHALTIERVLGSEQVSQDDLDELDRAIASLDDPHEELLAQIAEEETGRSRDLLLNFRALNTLFGTPWRKLLDVRDELRNSLVSAMKEAVKHDKEKLDAINKKLLDVGNQVKQVQKDYSSSTIYTVLDDVAAASEWLNDLDAEIGKESICSFLRVATHQYESARASLDILARSDLSNPEVWNLNSTLVERLPVKSYKKDLIELDTVFLAGAREIKRIACIWPDLGRRDRYSYHDFEKFANLGVYERASCSGDDVLPYARACK